MSNRASDNVLRELALLAALDSVQAKIDISDIAEIQDWTGAVVGKFYEATVEKPSSAFKLPAKSPASASQPVAVSVPLPSSHITSGSMDHDLATTRLLVDMQTGNK